MDATEYVGRRARRALGMLPAALVGAAAVGAAAGLVGLWRLTTPTTGFVGGDAAGTLWERVTMAIATGYDVAPLGWGALALVVLAVLAHAPRSGLPTPGPGVRRAATLLAGALAAVAVVAVVVVVAWALLTHGEVSFSVEVPGDQDGGRVTTQVGTYQTDAWVALLHVVPAVVAAVLAGGSLAALLHPPVATVEQVERVEPAVPAERVEPGERAEPAERAGDLEPGTPAPGAVGLEQVGRDHDRVTRGSGGAARFARSVATGATGATGGAGGAGGADPLAGWTMGPGTTSDVAFRRPGSGAASGPASGPAVPHDAPPLDGRGPAGLSPSVTGDADGREPEAGVRAADPYRRPGA